MKLPLLSIALPAALALVGWGRPALGAEGPPTPTNSVHSLRGVIREIAANRRRAVIQHEAVPDYMPAMTMGFNVRDAKELSGLAVGDTITCTLTVTPESYWISDIRKVAGGKTNQPAGPPRAVTADKTKELKRGDVLPDAELVAEDGRHIRFSDFRGQALAFTFFFTRCPLPDYCPRMAANFAAARALLLTRPAFTNWQLLSISFDPDFDRPAVLAAYAKAYRADIPEHWLFSAASVRVLRDLGPRLDLLVHRDPDGGISHNLRTVVLDPKGRIFRQFDGNEWKPEELVEAVAGAAQTPARR
jgi:protein SCO1/2